MGKLKITKKDGSVWVFDPQTDRMKLIKKSKGKKDE